MDRQGTRIQQESGNDHDMEDLNSNKRSVADETDDATRASKKKKSNSFLSEEEKKARHIASEKKRRETIRLAFDRIVDLVPDLTPAESRTEVAILTKSAKFIDQLKQENARLVYLLQQNGVEVPSHLLEEFGAQLSSQQRQQSQSQSQSQQQ